MQQFFQELKRRNVIRVGVAYLAVGWLVIQIAETLLPAYGFTDAALRNLVAIIGVGLIITVALAWIFEWTPQGIFTDDEAKSSRTVRKQDTKNLDRFIILSLVAAVVFFAVDKFILDPSRDAQNIEVATEKALADALLARKNDKSVAVLPFANRSNRDDDVYFVDGIHDDILTQLARIGALSVTSRTSVEQYRGTTKTMKEIGTALDVRTILEGGVQRAGDRVRINVQLIDTTNDDHLWAESYERELTAENIFSVQADIATKVADALRAALLPDEQLALQKRPTDSYQAYDLYLLGRYHLNQRSKDSVDLAQGYFEQAIEQDPDFVLALSGLSDSYIFGVYYGTLTGEFAFPLAEDIVDRAMQLDDSSSEVWVSLGLLREVQKQLSESEGAYRRAIDLDPENFAAWFFYSQMLWRQHRYADALAAVQTAYALEPMSKVVNDDLAFYYWLLGDFAQSRQHMRRADQVAQSQSIQNSESIIATYYWSGEFSRAIEESRKFLSTEPDAVGAMGYLSDSYLVFGSIDEAQTWAERAASISTQYSQGYRLFEAQGDFGGVIEFFENRLETEKPRRNLWVLFEMFQAHYFAGDLSTARTYLAEYIDVQQGRLEIRPTGLFQLNNLAVAAFWINHGDATMSEPTRGHELAEEIQTKLTALKDQGWLHPQMFISLAGADVLLGNNGAALVNLNEAIDSGYRNQQFSLRNLAFDGLRDDPGFVLASARIQDLIDQDKTRLAGLDLAPYTPPVGHETIVLSRETLEIYAGWYSDGNALCHIYIADDGHLMGTVGQNPANELVAIADDEFYSPANKTFTAQFISDENGVITHFIVKGAFGELLFKAVDDPPLPIQLSREALARFEGTYSHDRLGDLEAERAETDLWGADIYVDDDGKIWVDYDNQPKLEIQPISETEFDLIGFDGGFIFDVDPDSGAINHFIMTQDGTEFLFYRQ